MLRKINLEVKLKLLKLLFVVTKPTTAQRVPTLRLCKTTRQTGSTNLLNSLNLDTTLAD